MVGANAIQHVLAVRMTPFKYLNNSLYVAMSLSEVYSS